MTTVSFTDTDGTDKDILFRQYVSDPIAAQTISAQALKFQMRCLENSIDNNMYLALGIRVVSGDGGTVRGTILAVTRDDVESVIALYNRQFTATSTQVIAQDGDRIVIEVGMGGEPIEGSDHDSSISIGDDSGTDLPEDDTTTTTYNPWVEFANTIPFITLLTQAETIVITEDIKFDVAKRLKETLKISETVGLSFLYFTTQSENLKITAIPDFKIIYGESVNEIIKISGSLDLKITYNRNYSGAIKIRDNVSVYLIQKNKPLNYYEPKYLIDMALTNDTYHFSGEDIYITT